MPILFFNLPFKKHGYFLKHLILVCIVYDMCWACLCQNVGGGQRTAFEEMILLVQVNSTQAIRPAVTLQ